MLDDKDSRVVERVESVRKNGLIELPIVRRTESGYQIATGHIRIRACVILGMTKVECIVRPLTDEQMAVVVVEENLKHETLNPIEQGKGYRNMKDHFNWSEEKIAEKFGTTRHVVAQRLRLLSFQEPLQQLIAEGRFGVSHAEAVNMAPYFKQMDLAKRVLEAGLTVQQTTDEAKRLVAIERANKSAMENIGTIVENFTSWLNQLEGRIFDAERSLAWVELDEGHVWKHKSCMHNVNGWCHRFSWDNEPEYFLLTDMANIEKREDGKWHIQACAPACGHCTVYEERPSNPQVPKLS